MADINPAARPRNSVFYDGLTANPVAGRLINQHRLQLNTYFLLDLVDDNDIAAPRGAIACAWQGNTTGDTAAFGIQTTSNLTSIRCQTAAATPDGWLHVLSGGSQDFTETDDKLATQKVNVAGGVNGYVQQGSIFVNHKSAAPNTLTNARVTRTSNLRLQFYPFTSTVSAGDRWKAATGTRGTDMLCSNIVSVAWQANVSADLTDAASATLNASGDVIFTNGGSTVTGYLWVWRRV